MRSSNSPCNNNKKPQQNKQAKEKKQTHTNFRSSLKAVHRLCLKVQHLTWFADFSLFG